MLRHSGPTFRRLAVATTGRRQPGPMGSVAHPASYMLQMQQDRQLWTLIGGGLALFAISRVGLASIEKLEDWLDKKNEESSNGNANPNPNAGEKEKESSSSNNSNSSSSNNSDSKSKSSSTSSSSSSKSANKPPESKPKKVTIKNAFGIDFGSSSAKLAYRDANKICLIDTNDGKRYTPTSIHFSSDKIVAGQIAKSVRWLKQRHTLSAIPPMIQYTNIDDSTKAFLESFGMKTDCIATNGDLNLNLAGVEHKLSDLQANLIEEVIKSANSKAENYKRLPLLVSLPQFLASNHHQAFIDVCKLKSMPIIGTVGDAVSAYLGSQHLNLIPASKASNESFLVVDIGGKYTQYSILEKTADEAIPKVTASKISYKVSCDSIDNLLVQTVAKDFALKNKLNSDILNDNMAMQRIYDAVENAKIDLSKSMSTVINVPYLTADASGPKHLDFTLSRANMDRITSTLIESLKSEVSAFYAEKTKTKPIDHVILVGGGARMVSFRQEVEKAVGKPVIIASEPEEVVAIGSAVYSELV